jgi:hypothetical protein
MAPKQRFIREGDSLRDNDAVVVRGGGLEPEALRSDAARHFHIYGTYGLSVFALRGVTFDELAQQAPLVRFPVLTLFGAGDLRAAGLRLEPTGRNIRHFTIAFDDLDDGVARICGCRHVVRANPYHER